MKVHICTGFYMLADGPMPCSICHPQTVNPYRRRRNFPEPVVTMKIPDREIAETAISWWAKAYPTKKIAELLGCQEAEVGSRIVVLKGKYGKRPYRKHQ